MNSPNTDGPSYKRVSNQYVNGDPFGYIEGDHFVIIGPAENKAYLIDSEDKISSVNQNISSADYEEFLAQIKAAYPYIDFLTYQIKSYSIGDKINISGEV